MPRETWYRDLPDLAGDFPAEELRESERLLLRMLSEGATVSAMAERLGVSRVTVYRWLDDLRWKVAVCRPCPPAGAPRGAGSRRCPDPVREALELDPVRVRMRAALDLGRSFGDLPYAQKQVAGVNGLGWQARRWMARDRARRRDYLTKAGYGTPEEPRAVVVDDVCRLLARDLLVLYRIRVRVRCEGSEPPPPFPGGRGGPATWLATGDARGPCRVSQLIGAVRERLLCVVPPPERLGQAPLPRRRGRGPSLPVYLVPGLWVAVRWAVPWRGAERGTGEVRLARAFPAGRMSFGDLLGEERRVVGFVRRGPEAVRRALVAPLWEDSGRVEAALPPQLWWRRVGEGWFSLPAEFLAAGDRVRFVAGEYGWVLLARGIRVRLLPPVAVARLIGDQVREECLLATSGGAARLMSRFAVADEVEDCVWRYRPARRAEGRAGVREELARLERVWLS